MTNQRFQPGDAVHVRTGTPTGHCRTPAYIRGKVGQVVTVHSSYRNPEDLAHGGNGLPKRALYLVAFAQPRVWESRYRGPHGDTVWVDLYDHWLDPA